METRRGLEGLMTKAYYAHCLSIFNTPQERRDVAVLETLGFEVYNPPAPGS